MIFCVIIILCNHKLHYSEIIPGNYSESNKTNGTKIQLQLNNLWHIHGHYLNLRIANLKTPLFYSGL